MKNIKFIIIAFFCAVFNVGCVSESIEFQSVTLDIYDCRGAQPQAYKSNNAFIPAPNFTNDGFTKESGSLQELLNTNNKQSF